MELVSGYPLRRSDRARRISVKVSALGDVELVAPARASLRSVERFVGEQQAWIDRALRRLEPSLEVVRGRRLIDGGELPYLGEPHMLRFAGRPRTRPRVERRLGRIVLDGAPAGEGARRALLERWFRGQARLHLGSLLLDAAARHRVSLGRLQIRDQRTRWGSCSPRGDISLNWRLMLAPVEVGRYVVEHELAHLAVPDHSPAFWALMAERMPGYQLSRRWLTGHGATLRF